MVERDEFVYAKGRESMRIKFKCMQENPLIGDHDIDLLSQIIRLPVIGHVYRHRFQMALDLFPDTADNVLEIGYGAGFLAYVIAPRVTEYHGIDIHNNPDVVKTLMEKYGLKNARFINGDARELASISDKSYDLVMSVSCLEHIAEHGLVQGQIYRVLKPGGFAIYGLPTKHIITHLFFLLLGYDGDVIHPTRPMDIIESAIKSGFSFDCERFFPYGFGHKLGLYWAGRFQKPPAKKLERLDGAR
jgi:SAM-dependent methyltransferase